MFEFSIFELPSELIHDSIELRSNFEGGFAGGGHLWQVNPVTAMTVQCCAEGDCDSRATSIQRMAEVKWQVDCRADMKLNFFRLEFFSFCKEDFNYFSSIVSRIFYIVGSVSLLILLLL